MFSAIYWLYFISRWNSSLYWDCIHANCEQGCKSWAGGSSSVLNIAQTSNYIVVQKQERFFHLCLMLSTWEMNGRSWEQHSMWFTDDLIHVGITPPPFVGNSLVFSSTLLIFTVEQECAWDKTWWEDASILGQFLRLTQEALWSMERDKQYTLLSCCTCTFGICWHC